MPSTAPLDERFRRNLRELGLGSDPVHLLVAVSGGCDSVALLHLLRAAGESLALSVTVGHLDHAMRDGSAADALWVRGLCTAWGVPLIVERLEESPAGETAARAARYAFLRRAAAAAGADLIALGHHADDQAETVLFRAARGTGLHGLGGMRPRTASGLVRPLLPFWRREIAAYAREARLSWRSDPTNLLLGPSRNRIRRRILPELEREVAPGTRRNLVRLAETARESEHALARIARAAAREVVREEEDALIIACDRLSEYDPAVAARVVRIALRRFGSSPGRTGTRAAVQFITDASSGRELQLPGGISIRREFADARIARVLPAAPDEPVEIAASPDRPYERQLRVGGADYRVRIGADAPRSPAGDAWRVELDPDSAAFPLRLRGWRPGDRVRTAGGSKSLKKLFLEERVPRSRRARLPVLEDAAGRVLWVAGVRRRLLPPPPRGGAVLFLTIQND